MIINEKYKVEGMSCAACSARVDRAVRNLEGVKEVNVNLLTNSMVVSYEESISSKDIEDAVKKAGYKASKVVEESTTSKKKENYKDLQTRSYLIRMIVSLILLVPLFYFGMGFMLNWPIGLLRENLIALTILEMTLALAINIINRHFYISGTKALFHGGPNMDTLVMLGAGISFIWSAVMAVFVFLGIDQHMHMMDICFETAGMIPTFITIGKTLESYSKGKSTNAIKSLINLAPSKTLLIKDDKEYEVPTEEVQIGDLFLVKAGESFPVDGEIIKGYSDVNESMLTGEAMPIFKKEGDIVKSGTVNGNGSLVCKAIQVGNKTTLNQIVRMVEEASNSKARINNLTNKISGIFVPVVVGIALIVFLCWFFFGKGFIESHSITESLLSYSIKRAVAVLVISCPCALGLATPVAIMVSSGKGAKNGILFKNATAIEESEKISYLLLDKTGTITKGKPTISDIYAEDEKELLSIAYSLECLSNHPLALPIIEKGKELALEKNEVIDFETIPGKGIKGIINNECYYAGNIKYISGITTISERYLRKIDELVSLGKTSLIFAKNGEIIGVIAESDEIKEESKAAITKIKELGIVPIMLTGDNYNSAKHIAEQVGIDYVISNLLPEDKLEVVKMFQKHGKTMMVGDGINDSIALTQADVGVGIASGSDIAIESCNVVLMKSSLEDIYRLISLSHRTNNVVKENLFWAFFYNIIMVTIAAGTFSTLGLPSVPPWMSSAVMAVSSVFVVTNSLRINVFNLDKKKKKNKKVIIPDFLNQTCEIKEEINMTKTFKVEGMMCNHCVMHVKKALEEIDGVISAEVDLKAEKATITSSKEIDNKTIENKIDEAGYKAIL